MGKRKSIGIFTSYSLSEEKILKPARHQKEYWNIHIVENTACKYMYQFYNGKAPIQKYK